MTDEEKAQLEKDITEIAEFEKMTEIEKLQDLKEKKQLELETELANEKAFKDELRILEDEFAEFLK